MSLKDAYRQKMEAQIEEQRARIELFKAQAKKVIADGKIMAYEELADAEVKLEAARSKLKELGGASGAAYEDIKSGVEHAWTDLSTACKMAAGKIKGKP